MPAPLEIEIFEAFGLAPHRILVIAGTVTTRKEMG
jgi:hypothetical protein